MELKLKVVYLGITEKKYEMEGRKGVSIKAKTAMMDGSGNTLVWKIKEANHALQKKVHEMQPFVPVVITVNMVCVKDEAKLELVDMAVAK